jgi:hypothetical protein
MCVTVTDGTSDWGAEGDVMQVSPKVTVVETRLVKTLGTEGSRRYSCSMPRPCKTATISHLWIQHDDNLSSDRTIKGRGEVLDPNLSQFLLADGR